MTGPDGRSHVAVGIYGEIVPPSRLAFTWDWEDSATRVGDTLVTGTQLLELIDNYVVEGAHDDARNDR